MEEYLIVREASDRFDVPMSRIYQWMDAKKINKYLRKSDGKVMVKIEEIKEYLASQNEVVPAEE